MSTKERVIRLMDDLSEVDLRTVERMLRGLKLPEEPEPVSPEEHRAKVRAAYGAFADVPTSVDDFLARKHEDTEREEERYRRRHPEEA